MTQKYISGIMSWRCGRVHGYVQKEVSFSIIKPTHPTLNVRPVLEILIIKSF